MKTLSPARVKKILATARRRRILVIGDVMLDQFIWGRVDRISPEAPVPVVEFLEESYMPGGAANVARNLTALQVPTAMFSLIGRDEAGRRLTRILREQGVDCSGLRASPARATIIKTRIVAQRQQLVRVDRETRREIGSAEARSLLRGLEPFWADTAAIILGDYGKGVLSQMFLEQIKSACRERGVWLSLDPKPIHQLDLVGLSLITPNRKEAFALADIIDPGRSEDPLRDEPLLEVAHRLIEQFQPSVLLITLGENGMLVATAQGAPYHIPTVAREVFDVSGAGDTVIASFTLAISAGATPEEAAMISNHAAGVVVGKIGTATVTPVELLRSFISS